MRTSRRGRSQRDGAAGGVGSGTEPGGVAGAGRTAGSPVAARLRGGLLLLVVLSSAGCASLFGSFHTAPDGLSPYEHGLRELVRAGRFDSALHMVAPERSSVGDGLLRLQYEALLAHYANRPEESNEALESALLEVEERYTKSVSRALLSVLTNDRVLAYDPPSSERFLLHYYGALNYLRLERPDEAAVEARRLSHRLTLREDEATPEGARRDMHVFLHRFAGAVFEAAGDADAAGVSYRRAARLEAGTTPAASLASADGDGRSPPGPAAADAASADSTVGSPRAAESSGRVPRADSAAYGEVVLVVERGFVAHRVERSLNLPLWPAEMAALRSGAESLREEEAVDEERMDVALRVARRGLDGGEPAGNGPFSGALAGALVGVLSNLDDDEAEECEDAPVPEACREKNAQEGDRDDEDDGRDGPYLLRVAWPAYRADPVRGSIEVTAAGRASALASPSPTTLDLSDAVREEFRDGQTLRLAKTVIRAVGKAAAAGELEDQLSDEDETLGEVAGVAANVVGALTERADTRSWHLLPGRLELVRLRLPAGRHTVTVRSDAPAARGGRSRTLDPIPVRAGETVVASVRLWR